MYKRILTRGFILQLNCMSQPGYTFKYPLPSRQPITICDCAQPSLAAGDNRSRGGPEGRERAQGSMFTATYTTSEFY